jgi:hypothetical protein
MPECQQGVGWAEAIRDNTGRCGMCEGALFELHVRV